MSNINSRGDYTSQGGGNFYNGKRISDGAGASFLNDDNIICTNTFASVDVYNIPTDTWIRIANQGFNFLDSGGSQWIAKLSDVFGSRNWPVNCGPLNVANDGTTIVIPPGFFGLDLYKSDGTLVHGPQTIVCQDASAVYGGDAVWIEGGKLVTLSGRKIKQANSNYHAPQLITKLEFPFLSQDWIKAYIDAFGTIILHPVLDVDNPTPLEGYVVVAGESTFYVNCCALASNIIRVRYSKGQGDIPSDVVIVDQNLNDARVSLEVTPNPIPVPVPNPVPVPIPPSGDLTYHQWVVVESKLISDKYKEVHGEDESIENFAHQSWRRLHDGTSLVVILHDV